MKTVEVSGIWIRAGNPAATKVEVLAEVGGEWLLLATETCDGPFSHIIEPLGIAAAPRDPGSEAAKMIHAEAAIGIDGGGRDGKIAVSVATNTYRCSECGHISGAHGAACSRAEQRA